MRLPAALETIPPGFETVLFDLQVEAVPMAGQPLNQENHSLSQCCSAPPCGPVTQVYSTGPVLPPSQWVSLRNMTVEFPPWRSRNEAYWEPWGCRFYPCLTHWVGESRVAVSCGVGHRHGSAPVWLWLAAVALILPLAWEPPYTAGTALKSQKKKGGGEKKETLPARDLLG